MAAAKDIGINEAYLYVPTKLMICETRVRQSDIGHVIEEQKSFFDDEHKIIMFFIVHEMSKGKDSLWHPCFQISEKPDLPAFWEDDELQEMQD